MDDILEGENITQYTLPPSGSDYEKLRYLSKYQDFDIDFSDPDNDFFNSQCFIFTSDSGKDVLVKDRRKFFFNDIQVCEENCVFVAIDEKFNRAICNCTYSKNKNKTKEITFSNYGEHYFIFDMWKCISKDIFKGKIIKTNYIFIIVLILLFLTILFIILYFCLEQDKYKFASMIVENTCYSSIFNCKMVIKKNMVSSPRKKMAKLELNLKKVKALKKIKNM